jgi:16S rRNA (guanine(966)-N(2))-methyltransferase RsmD
LRIIAGRLKGRRLITPTWEGLRPTSDKLRETLFNVIAPRVAGARVLDGYAGTGALGIEALSRGASDVAFIEQDPRAARLIAENLAHCGLTDGYVIIRAPVERGLASLRAGAAFMPFDLMLLDPPYDEHLEAVLGAVAGALAPGGLVVLEHARRQQPPARAGRLALRRDLTSGDSALAFYEPD